MTPESLDLDLPTDPPLPPPPPENPDAIRHWQAQCLAEFYQSPPYEEWYRRTSEELRNAVPFVMD